MLNFNSICFGHLSRRPIPATSHQPPATCHTRLVRLVRLSGAFPSVLCVGETFVWLLWAKIALCVLSARVGGAIYRKVNGNNGVSIQLYRSLLLLPLPFSSKVDLHFRATYITQYTKKKINNKKRKKSSAIECLLMDDKSVLWTFYVSAYYLLY